MVIFGTLARRLAANGVAAASGLRNVVVVVSATVPKSFATNCGQMHGSPLPAIAAAIHNLQHLTFVGNVRQYSRPAKHQKGKAGASSASDSDSDSDLEVLGHRGESLFWRRKMRTFHRILDVNRDGVISSDDFNLLAERFIDLGHLSEKHTKEFRAVLKDLWENRWGGVTPYVTVEQFLDDMHHVLNDKQLVKRAHSFLPYIFKAVDKDKSGVITVEEFKLFFECLGLDTQDAVLAFRAIDTNCDGKVTSKEFLKHGRDYFVTEDENRISKYLWGPLVDH